MNDNNSSITMKKSDGSPITFNFQLDNGLPYKPIFTPNFTFVHSKKTDEYGIYITFSPKDLNELKSLEIIGYNLFNNDLWINLNNYYIVLYKLNDKIISELQKNNLVVCFLDENKDFLNGFKIG